MSARPPCGGVAVIGGDGSVLPRPLPGTLVFGAARTGPTVIPDPADYDLGVVIGAAPDDARCLHVLWGHLGKDQDGLPGSSFVLYGGGQPTKEGWGRNYVHVWRRLVVVGHAVIDGTADAVSVNWRADAVVPPCFYCEGDAHVLALRAQQQVAESRSLGRGAKRQQVQALAAVPSRLFALIPVDVGGSSGRSKGVDTPPSIRERVVIGRHGPSANRVGVIKAKHNGHSKV